MNPPNTPREQSASEYERAAAELERAAQHLRQTAQHFRDGEIPRGCAHAWAAQGHLLTVEQSLATLAQLHASHSRV